MKFNSLRELIGYCKQCPLCKKEIIFESKPRFTNQSDYTFIVKNDILYVSRIISNNESNTLSIDINIDNNKFFLKNKPRGINKSNYYYYIGSCYLHPYCPCNKYSLLISFDVSFKENSIKNIFLRFEEIMYNSDILYTDFIVERTYLNHDLITYNRFINSDIDIDKFITLIKVL